MRHRLCGLSTYGLNGYEREMSTPPTLRRGTADFTLLFLVVAVEGWSIPKLSDGPSWGNYANHASSTLWATLYIEFEYTVYIDRLRATASKLFA